MLLSPRTDLVCVETLHARRIALPKTALANEARLLPGKEEAATKSGITKRR